MDVREDGVFQGQKNMENRENDCRELNERVLTVK